MFTQQSIPLTSYLMSFSLLCSEWVSEWVSVCACLHTSALNIFPVMNFCSNENKSYSVDIHLKASFHLCTVLVMFCSQSIHYLFLWVLLQTVMPSIHFTKQYVSVAIIVTSYFGGPGFKSWVKTGFSHSMFIIYLIPLTQLPGQYREIGCAIFLPYPFQFIIHNSFSLH
jgi:hypothetical protein